MFSSASRSYSGSRSFPIHRPTGPGARLPPTAAISFSTPGKKYSLPGWAYPVALLGIFFGIILIAKLTGHWESGVSPEDLKRLVPIAESLMHP